MSCPYCGAKIEDGLLEVHYAASCPDAPGHVQAAARVYVQQFSADLETSPAAPAPSASQETTPPRGAAQERAPGRGKALRGPRTTPGRGSTGEKGTTSPTAPPGASELDAAFQTEPTKAGGR